MIDKILPGVAGIDIGADSYFVAVAGELPRKFGTYTSEVRQVSQYLREHQVERVAMEATGVYWIPLHDHLDSNGFEVTVFNGAHARNLPGRKTDVGDCQWHAMLHSHGLLKSCFIPSPAIRELRSYHRLREDYLHQASSHIQRMQKNLDLMNVRLHRVSCQIHGVSGLRVIEAILAGERNARKLVELCDVQIVAKKRAEVVASLEGNWEEHHLFGLRKALEDYRYAKRQMEDCDREMEALLQKWNDGKPTFAPKTQKVVRHNAPQIDNMHCELLTVCSGVDATVLPGISPLTMLKLISELGTDLSAWATEKHFTSWLGLAPTRHESGKMRRRVKRRKTVAGQIFKEAVMGVVRTLDTALGAFYRILKARKGPLVANTATARKLAEMYYRLMTKGLDYVEQGRLKYEENHRKQRLKRLSKMANNMGYTLIKNTPETALSV